jgi:hypothetical protein
MNKDDQITPTEMRSLFLVRGMVAVPSGVRSSPYYRWYGVQTLIKYGDRNRHGDWRVAVAAVRRPCLADQGACPRTQT